MTHEIIMAGFGGQGIMLIGTLLTYAGMKEGKKVSWLPSYGPEMRGGTANCAVVVSDEEIASPIVTEPTSCIVMNGPSFAKFHKALVPGGLLVLNSSLVKVDDRRGDIRVLKIPANDVAREVGSEKVANMVCLGALVEATSCVALDSVIKALKEVIHERHHNLLPMNEEALKKGASLVRAGA